MPRKTKVNNEAPNREYAKTQWVRYELNADEIGMLKAAVENDEMLIAKALNHFIKMNCKIQIQYDYENKATTAMIFPIGERNANFGKALSGRGQFAHSAVLEAYWKTKMLHDTWPTATNNESTTWDSDIEWS
jgi:hypothetical protein